jgi:hypothetical protein
MVFGAAARAVRAATSIAVNTMLAITMNATTAKLIFLFMFVSPFGFCDFFIA